MLDFKLLEGPSEQSKRTPEYSSKKDILIFFKKPANVSGWALKRGH